MLALTLIIMLSGGIQEASYNPQNQYQSIACQIALDDSLAKNEFGSETIIHFNGDKPNVKYTALSVGTVFEASSNETGKIVQSVIKRTTFYIESGLIEEYPVIEFMTASCGIKYTYDF
jgi:hypothetical protein